MLSEIVLHQNGAFKRVRRYLRGIHPERGVIVRGFTGWETLEEKDVICGKLHKFTIIDITPSIVSFAEIPVESDELAVAVG